MMRDRAFGQHLRETVEIAKEWMERGRRMSQEIEVKSIKLQLGRKEVELTVEEAKKLKSALDGFLGKEIVRECGGWWWYPYTYKILCSSDEPSGEWRSDDGSVVRYNITTSCMHVTV